MVTLKADRKRILRWIKLINLTLTVPSNNFFHSDFNIVPQTSIFLIIVLRKIYVLFPSVIASRSKLFKWHNGTLCIDKWIKVNKLSDW